MDEKPRATIEFKTKKGFGVLMTITSDMTNQQIGELCDNIEAAELQASNHGFEPAKAAAYKSSSQPPLTAPPQDLGNCKYCGSPNAWSSKKNKPYCSARCWLKNKNETQY